MKKFIFLLLLLLTLTACGRDTSPEDTAKFYYPLQEITLGSNSTSISFEVGDRGNNSVQDLLSVYLKGPQTNTLANPFPADISLISLLTEDGKTSLILSDSYASLTGLDLSLANASLAQTVLGLTGAEEAIISCESKTLDGESHIAINKDDLILLDESIGPANANDAASSTTE